LYPFPENIVYDLGGCCLDIGQRSASNRGWTTFVSISADFAAAGALAQRLLESGDHFIH
jgi:hypothetical protein